MADASLRERKKQKTREALEEAAIRLFLEKGYSGTSIEDIASEAEVSRRTFFRYFGSKEGVIFADADQQGAAMVQALLAQPRDVPPLNAYRDAIVALSQVVASDQEAILAKQKVVMNTFELRTRASEIARQWRGRFAETLATRAGRDQPDESDGILAGVAIAVLTAAIEDWVAAGGRDDLIERLRRAFDVVCEEPSG
ncbi:MAG TPA: TetR family transcriptional regulator [Actinomycetota bacterium]|nr:TetR family transcriptional regulator [Actinomycetota bacterium]